MYSFKELRKASKLKIDGKQEKVAVLGNCATQFFSISVQGYSRLSSMNVDVYDADYRDYEGK